jgi:segregation and condensation protein B
LVEQVEAILFVADSPVSLASLARALDVTEGQAEAALEVLQQRLDERSAVQVVKLAGGYQLSTRPEFADLIGSFLKPQRSKLSRSLLEVLAIVAYKQPITMAEIETIRGVQSDYAIRGLLDRRLIQEVGRRPTPGRPILLGTSKQFLHHFHLNDLSELPSIGAVPLLERQDSGHPSLFDERQEG